MLYPLHVSQVRPQPELPEKANTTIASATVFLSPSRIANVKSPETGYEPVALFQIEDWGDPEAVLGVNGQVKSMQEGGKKQLDIEDQRRLQDGSAQIASRRTKSYKCP